MSKFFISILSSQALCLRIVYEVNTLYNIPPELALEADSNNFSNKTTKAFFNVIYTQNKKYKMQILFNLASVLDLERLEKLYNMPSSIVKYILSNKLINETGRDNDDYWKCFLKYIENPTTIRIENTVFDRNLMTVYIIDANTPDNLNRYYLHNVEDLAIISQNDTLIMDNLYKQVALLIQDIMSDIKVSKNIVQLKEVSKSIKPVLINQKYKDLDKRGLLTAKSDDFVRYVDNFYTYFSIKKHDYRENDEMFNDLLIEKKFICKKEEQFYIAIYNRILIDVKRLEYNSNFVKQNSKIWQDQEKLDAKVEKLIGTPVKCHRDISNGLYSLFCYYKYFKLDSICQIIRQILEHCNVIVLGNPNVIRKIFQDNISLFINTAKTGGHILIHSNECAFGYRIEDVDTIEVEKQLDAWFGEGALPDHYKSKQVAFFRESFKEFINYKFRSMDDTIYQKIKNNCQKFTSIWDIYGNKYTLFNAQGSSGQSVDKEETTSNKKLRLNKTTFFALSDKISELYFDSNEIKNINLDNKKVNKVIIKRENLKQRTVVNTTLETYIPLSKIAKFLTKITAGIDVFYTNSNKIDKSKLYDDYAWYICDNYYMGNSHLQLPLDYSQFDRTISLELIEECIYSFAELTPYFKEIKKEFILFKELLMDEVIVTNEKGISRKDKYKSGVLSGWKITNIIETLINAVMTFGVYRRIKEFKSIEKLNTMGDDVISSVECTIYENQFDDIITQISSIYNSFGFIVNKSKQSISYTFNEFLRTTIYRNLIKAYPYRAFISLFFKKPTGKMQINDFHNFFSNIDDFVSISGLIQLKFNIVDDLSLLNLNPEIVKYASQYVRYPSRFRLYYTTKIVNQVDVNLVDKYFNQSELLNFYKKIFYNVGFDTAEIDKTIKNYLRNVILAERFVIVSAAPAQNINTPYVTQATLNKLIDISDALMKHVDEAASPIFKFNDYNFIQILKIVLSHTKGDVKSKAEIIQSACYEYVNRKGLTSQIPTVLHNAFALKYAKNEKQLFRILTEYKIPCLHVYQPALLVSQIRKELSTRMIWYFNLVEPDDCLMSKYAFDYSLKYIVQSIITYKCLNIISNGEWCSLLNYQSW